MTLHSSRVHDCIVLAAVGDNQCPFHDGASLVPVGMPHPDLGLNEQTRLVC